MEIKQPGGFEIQLTTSLQNHWLSPFGPFSRDNKLIVYDTRTEDGAMGGNGVIETVNIETGKTTVIYRVPGQNPYGPGCGTPSFSPAVDRVVFIRGVMNADSEHPYGQSRRTGVIVDFDKPGHATTLDARDVKMPFTPGALRGGSHAHEWSGDGKWIGFTYNDAIMARLGPHYDLRTVGVAADIGAVKVDLDAAGENNDGAWFAVLVARVVPDPKPGSDEISRAFENAWVGSGGYLKQEGSRQRAQAYLGLVKTADGKDVPEIFISEIPERIDVHGDLGPLEGTTSDFPMPPKGVIQRRLTHTGKWKFPGVVTEPRHWVACPPDGRFIAFLARDEGGVIQIFLVSPLGGEPIQLTQNPWPVQSTINWSPDSAAIVYVADGSLFSARVDEKGRLLANTRLTEKKDSPPIYPMWSRDGKMIAYNREVETGGQVYRQIFLLKLEKK